ncbi:SRPBCC family protein [Sphingomonas sp.]|uniref:SRPBCC family protein n=1 Tax=Sphingomonas sp. TaxID=28214 RepID=UPI001B2799F4|nr:SRPBCC family protein [Sphingomonas sp.]MBO9713741.1 SRPBCC family protein [Sphingomonas sp.]
MPDTPAVHDRFTIERVFPHAPAKVFAAFSTEDGKQRWFSGPNDMWEMVERKFDFSVGGIETIEGRWKSGQHHPEGTVTRMDLVYHDIVPDRRIVYAYRMAIDHKPISVSMTSIELMPAEGGTKLLLTEHGIYLDGYDDAGSRAHGVGWQIDKLGATLPD